MEKELGAPLFERSGRSVLLTPYGEVFYEHVCLALRAIDDGVAAVSARSSASFGTVNLGTTFTTQDTICRASSATSRRPSTSGSS